MPIAVTAELKRQALAEMQSPRGAFDVTGRVHPLQWIIDAPLATDEETTMPAYGTNLRPRGGYDQTGMPGPRGGSGMRYGDQDPDDDDQNGNPDDNGDMPLDAATILTALRQALTTLSPGERANLLAGMVQLTDEQNASSAEGNGNGNGMDGRRRVRSRAAMDAAFAFRANQSASFAKRFPDAARVQNWGTR
jgi:hypothetical protein